MDKKNFEKRCRGWAPFSDYRQTRSILNRWNSEWYQSIQNVTGSVLSKKKIFEKKFMLGRDLVITVKLAQFLTDRAESGTSRFRMLPGVS